MAFRRVIYKNTDDSQQSSPAYVLTFVRWSNRDTINYSTDAQDTRRPLVVINDAISVQAVDSKASTTGSATVVLKAADINYATAVSPGDYLIVNLLNDEKKAVEVAERALVQKNINRYQDGFKGLYKIQKVRRQIVVNEQTGHKVYQYVIHAFSFSEFNTVIYYNPTATKAFRESRLLFLSQFADFWTTTSTDRGNLSNVQKILVKLTKALLGEGLRNKGKGLGIDSTSNDQFKVPKTVANLLGVRGVSGITIPDIYRFVFGIWKGSSNTQISENEVESSVGTIARGFNRGITQIESNQTFFQVGKGGEGERLQGWRLLAAEDFNYKSIWSIIQSYMNSSINEAYTCNRVGVDGNVYPTMIVRQKPFNSQHFETPNKVQGSTSKKNPRVPFTRFFDLPQWRIDPDIIYSIDLGKDEISRVNYVQLYGRSLSVLPSFNESLQARNIYYDQDDIQRHGLKPSIVTSNFDFPLNQGADTTTDANKWAALLFDMLNAGQNRESGTITCYGIVEPICVGDNLVFDGNVYHIEAVSHSLSISAGGRKTFRTNLTVSFGTNLASNRARPVYPQQENTFVDQENIRDYERIQERVLPGISEAQNLPYSERSGNRRLGEQVKNDQERQRDQASFSGPAVNTPAGSRPDRVGINKQAEEQIKKSQSKYRDETLKKDKKGQ